MDVDSNIEKLLRKAFLDLSITSLSSKRHIDMVPLNGHSSPRIDCMGGISVTYYDLILVMYGVLLPVV